MKPTKHTLLLLLFTLLTVITTSAQYERFARINGKESFPWKDGKRCAVSLTFDDARRSQVDIGTALLKKHGVKATFYVLPRAMTQRTEKWKQAVADGHELANHTLSHPCSGNAPFSRRNALEDFTLQQIQNELEQSNEMIQKMFGVSMVSFAYPCGHSFVGRGTEVKSYVPLIAETFISGRGWLGENTNDPWFCDLAQLQGVESDGKSFEELRTWVQNAERDGRWLVLAGHEINEEGSQTTSVSALEKLCAYLTDEKNGIWVDTVSNIAEHILNVRDKE